MLEKITKKVYHELSVPDLDGVLHDVKVLNFIASGAKTGKLDRQCVVDINSMLLPGMIITLPDGLMLIISYKQADIYKNKVIRYTLDCTEATHKMDIRRTVLIKNNQGGLSDKTDVLVYHSMPVKIGLIDISESKVIDVSIPRFVMYASHAFELQIGDRITLSDSSFEEAKINSLVHVTPGLMEVRFDKDPRWL